MFLQKLVLDPTKSYESSAPVENLVENLHLLYKRVPVITLYASKALSNEQIEQLLGESKPATIELTIPQYSTYSSRFDSSHVVVRDFSLLSAFGYSAADIDRPLIVSDKCGLEKLPLCKFFVNIEKNERFVALYVLAQMFSVTVFSRTVARTEMFCKIFELNCSVRAYEDKIGPVADECVIFMDGYREVECERVFVLGGSPSGLERLSIDLGLAGKYKYRILDVMRQLSPSVVKKRDQFDYSRFRNINK